MVDGERWKEIDIGIIDNDVAELTKTFSVFLKNPTGGGTNDFHYIIVILLFSETLFIFFFLKLRVH